MDFRSPNHDDFSGTRIPHLFAFLALLLSTLAPAGFMPTQTANGFSIELCSGHKGNKLAITPEHPDYALLAMIYGDGEESGESEPQSETPLCDFAAGSAAGLTSDAPDIAANAMVPALHVPAQAKRFAVRNRINNPPATGPPVSV